MFFLLKIKKFRAERSIFYIFVFLFFRFSILQYYQWVANLYDNKFPVIRQQISCYTTTNFLLYDNKFPVYDNF